MHQEEEEKEEKEVISIPLGTRIKGYENVFTGPRIDPSKPFVMRLDGLSFSKFTRGVDKPYDYNLHQAFLNTTIELMREYRADTGYTHSDEISLLFYPKRTKNDDGWREPHFGGRIQKIISTAAAFCTMIFNNQLKEIFANKKDYYCNKEKEHAYLKMMSGRAYFDCRIFQLPDDVEMFSYMFWRSSVDCRRNHISELARRYYSKKELDGIGTNDRIKMLEEKGVIWAKEPPCFRHGSFIKRVKRQVEDDSIRFDFEEIDTELTKFNDNINEFLKCEVYSKEEQVENFFMIK